MNSVLYLISYPVTIPELPSLPGAVHVNLIEFSVGWLVARSSIFDGGISSSEDKVVLNTMLDKPDQIGVSSPTFTAK